MSTTEQKEISSAGAYLLAASGWRQVDCAMLVPQSKTVRQHACVQHNGTVEDRTAAGRLVTTCTDTVGVAINATEYVRSKGDVQAVWVCQLAVTCRCAMLYPAATTHTRSAASTGHSMRSMRLHTPGDNWAINHITHWHRMLHAPEQHHHTHQLSTLQRLSSQTQVKLGQTWSNSPCCCC
jgi:hypothetical protein